MFSLSPAPGVITMWLGAIGILLEYLRQGMPVPLSQFLPHLPFDPLEPAMLFWLRLPGVLLAVIAVGLTYRWSRPLLGRNGALLAAGFLALDPFGLALSRVLGHDSPVSIFMWLSLLAFLRSIKNRSSFTISNSLFTITSGALAGLACLSKYPAMSLGLFIAVTMLIVYLWQARSIQSPHKVSNLQLPSIVIRWLRDMLLWSAAAGLIFIILWPAMWVHPFDTVSTILGDALRASGGSHPKGSFFLGEPVPDPGWLFYPLVALFRTTPVVIVGVLLAVWALVRPRVSETANDRMVNKPNSHTTLLASRSLLIILIAFILFYGFLVTYGGKKQDRYLLPIFPALSMLATFGYLYLSGVTQHVTRNVQPVLRFMPVIILFLQAVFVLPAYPYYFSYYNPLAGGGRAAERLIQVGWGEGLNKAAAYLNTLPQVESIKAVSWYSTTFEPYFKGQTIYKIDEEKISRSSKPGLAADYVVFYVNQTQRLLPSEGALQFFQSVPPVYTVTINGIDYAKIYPSVGMQHVWRRIRLVGQSELLGYNLTSEAGQPVSNAYPESVVLVSLYWEWQGQAEGDKIGLSLVDGNNKTRGWGNPIETFAPLPRAEWQEGMVVRDNFALVIFPDTPPGDYHLAAWLSRLPVRQWAFSFWRRYRHHSSCASRGSAVTNLDTQSAKLLNQMGNPFLVWSLDHQPGCCAPAGQPFHSFSPVT
ncbi:MAG: glycosyltransferase family 39 protein [Anaerolineae bacterium]